MLPRIGMFPRPQGSASCSLLETIRRDGMVNRCRFPTGLRRDQADAAAARAHAHGVHLTDLWDAAIIGVEDIQIAHDGSGRRAVRSHNGVRQGTTTFLGAPTLNRVRTWIGEGGFHGGTLFRQIYAYRAGERGLSARGVQLAIIRHAHKVGFFRSRHLRVPSRRFPTGPTCRELAGSVRGARPGSTPHQGSQPRYSSHPRVRFRRSHAEGRKTTDAR